MFQLIGRQTSHRPGLRKGRLSDPDLLLEVHELFDRTPDEREKRALSRLFSQVLHDIRMGGAWKRTNEGRLKQTETMICKHLPAPLGAHVALLDLGASDGITTAELVAALEHCLDSTITAYLSDLNLSLERHKFGPFAEYRATNGEPIMARLGRIGLRLAEQRSGDRSGRDFLSRWYLGFSGVRRRLRLDRRIPLVNPTVSNSPNIIPWKLNCLDFDISLVGKFAIIRASNVLNLGYFSPEQIIHAVENLHGYLSDGGCLVVSRNVDEGDAEIENGSVWLREPDRMRWAEDFGSGSEVRSIIDAWRPNANATRCT